MMHRITRVALAVGGVVIMSTAVVGCGSKSATLRNAGKAASLNLSLTTVPTIRSVTVSPGSASFATCSGGRASQNTRSTTGKLGFPSGTCFVGLLSPGIYPITITNTGIASAIYVSGSSAIPADGGTEWALCNRGFNPFVDCDGGGGLPGTDQYQVQNFSPLGDRRSGISSTPTCDIEFDPRCWAVQGASQTEGLELIGPWASTDNSTKWTLTITWIPVPSQH